MRVEKPSISDAAQNTPNCWAGFAPGLDSALEADLSFEPNDIRAGVSLLDSPLLSDPKPEVRYVGWNEYVVARNSNTQNKLATTDLKPCVAVCGYDEVTQIGFLAHVFNEQCFQNSFGAIVEDIDRLDQSPKHFRVSLVSGHSDQDSSIVQTILQTLIHHNRTDLTFDIAHMELVNNPTGHSVAIDLSNGHLYRYELDVADLAGSTFEDFRRTVTCSNMVRA